VQYFLEKDIREKVGPIVVPIGRSVIGVVFGVVLSMLGIGVAWSLFIFFGFESIDVWKGLLYFGAGFGAGTGAFVAWLHLDRENGWVLLLTAAVVVGAGVVGSFGGFKFGEAQEVRCCARADGISVILHGSRRRSGGKRRRRSLCSNQGVHNQEKGRLKSQTQCTDG